MSAHIPAARYVAELGPWVFLFQNLKTIPDFVFGRSRSREIWGVEGDLCDPSHINDIFNKFDIPRQARIIPGDTKPRNYKGSLLLLLLGSIVWETSSLVEESHVLIKNEMETRAA